MLNLPLNVYLYAGAVVLAVPVLWWSVAAAMDPTAKLVRSNLGGGDGTVTDVRQVELSRSAKDRIIGPFFARLTGMAHRFTPASVVDGLDRRIALAGRVGQWPVERLLAGKMLLGVAGALFGILWFVTRPGFFGLVIGAAMPLVGYTVPDILLGQQGKRRQDLLLRKLPDALDQITISVEAGLGFEAAMAEAGHSGSGPLAEELIRTLQDIRIGVPRSQALTHLLDRTDVAELRHFVIAVRQAEQYGVPIAQVLRVHAKEIRERRRQRAEERAMKMPVKILFPTIFFILPSLFIVILGPAVLRLADSLGGH